MKKVLVFGVEMTGIQQMAFDKYLSNNSIAMNTITREERTQLAQKWLNENGKDLKTY